ncbi:MAG: RNA polymerase factor sigma-54 [bacterium]|nr:RNA polymerase factor sigma-54 [bacterium]
MIRLQLSQTISLQQKLAPQLIQSLRLLQMPTLELEQLIQQELELNPLLEIDEDPDGELEEETSEEEREESDEEEEESEGEALEELEFEEADLDKKDQFDENDWDHYLNESGYASPPQEFDPNIEDWDNDGVVVRSLEDLLLEQLTLTDLSEEERGTAHYIIGNIDEDGFFCSPVEEVADVLGVEVEDVERVLAVIQTFDPSGVGARDLRECLMIQLRELGLEQGRVMDIVRDYLDDLINRRYPKITRGLGLSKEELKEAEEVIASLNPKPNVEAEPAVNLNHVIPDLEVQKVGDEFVVSLTDRNVPSLRVSPIYRTLLSGSEKSGKEAKKFVVDKLNAARWFISAIHQRRTTMLNVMRCIVHNQIEFFKRGTGHLKPMVLQEVADKVEMHVSTISRVSNGKYVQTPYGVFQLKYFFDGGLSTDGGEDISAKTVKEKIKKLIHEENTHSPLSDQKIANILKEEGIDIARRTVAKYRVQLNINLARMRKAL